MLPIGDLGSYHTALDAEVFRGFALADDLAPFVVINDNDSSAAWTFTLLHELAHLRIGQTGVSGGRPDVGVERFCNDVASEFLVPEPDVAVLGAALTGSRGPPEEVLAPHARKWKVSRSLLAYRAFRAGYLPRSEWQRLDERFRRTWAGERDRRRERQRKREGGPSHYTLRRQRLGPALLDLTGRMLASGALSTTKAGRILGVKPAHVGRLVRERPGPASWR